MSMIVRNSALAAVALTSGVAWVGCAPPDPAESEASRPMAGTEVVSAGGDSLGVVHFPSSCTEAAQKELELGLALVHHLN